MHSSHAHQVGIWVPCPSGAPFEKPVSLLSPFCSLQMYTFSFLNAYPPAISMVPMPQLNTYNFSIIEVGDSRFLNVYCSATVKILKL